MNRIAEEKVTKGATISGAEETEFQAACLRPQSVGAKLWEREEYQETDSLEKKVEGLILMEKMRNYLIHFTPDSAGVDAVLLGIIYLQILPDQGFQP